MSLSLSLIYSVYFFTFFSAVSLFFFGDLSVCVCVCVQFS